MKSSVTLRRISVLLLLSPMMLLTGCAKQPEPLVEYQSISQPRLNLPAELTSPIDVPAVPYPLTFGGSVALSAELYGALGQCNIDRAAIREIESTDKVNSP